MCLPWSAKQHFAHYSLLAKHRQFFSKHLSDSFIPLYVKQLSAENTVRLTALETKVFQGEEPSTTPFPYQSWRRALYPLCCTVRNCIVFQSALVIEKSLFTKLMCWAGTRPNLPTQIPLKNQESNPRPRAISYTGEGVALHFHTVPYLHGWWTEAVPGNVLVQEGFGRELQGAW